LVQDEVKGRLNFGNIPRHLVPNLLSSHLLSKNLKIRPYKTINLSVVLYGCETWSLTLREECELTVFQNRMMRIFGKSRRMRYVAHVAGMREKRNACNLLVGKPEGKKPLGKPRHVGGEH
jgi:hypothetical protein